MAASQLLAPMPFYTLEHGCTVSFEAIDPNTGAAVTGVTVTLAAIYGVNDAPAETTPDDSQVFYAVLPDEPDDGGGAAA